MTGRMIEITASIMAARRTDDPDTVHGVHVRCWVMPVQNAFEPGVVGWTCDQLRFWRQITHEEVVRAGLDQMFAAATGIPYGDPARDWAEEELVTGPGGNLHSEFGALYVPRHGALIDTRDHRRWIEIAQREAARQFASAGRRLGGPHPAANRTSPTASAE